MFLFIRSEYLSGLTPMEGQVDFRNFPPFEWDSILKVIPIYGVRGPFLATGGGAGSTRKTPPHCETPAPGGCSHSLSFLSGGDE